MTNITNLQIKITRKYHLIPVSMDIIKKTRDNKYWQGCGEKETFVHFGGNVNCPATMENSKLVPQKIKSRTTT